jgi:hypothetical protein
MASRKKAEPTTPKVKEPRKSAGGLMTTAQREAEVARFLSVPRDVREAQLAVADDVLRRWSSRPVREPE